MKANIHARHLIEQNRENLLPVLDLGKCGIEDLEDIPELFESVHLETLIFSSFWIFEGESRKTVNEGRSNTFRAIPVAIANLTKLTHFICNRYSTYQKIGDVKAIASLVNLKHLDISYNRIADYAFLRKLTALKSINLSANSISDATFLQELTSLKRIVIKQNSIPNIQFIKSLINVEYFDASDNQIHEINPIKNITKLKYLDCSANMIFNIDPLATLNKLRHLYLSKNHITNISALTELAELLFLDVRHNKIKEIPQSIFQKRLGKNDGRNAENNNFYGNPVESPPAEIIAQGTTSITDWYSAKKTKLNEIKIILIGDPEAGKTSLLRIFKDGTFNEHEPQTDGINVEHLHFGDCPTFTANNSLHHITGHFWDFGGQEIMNATHQFFLTKRSIYILVIDARRDVDVSLQIRQWVQKIRASGGNSPIIIVANQIDVNPGFGFSNEYELTEDFPQIKAFIRASCKTKHGIATLKKKLEYLIPKAELFNTEMDERWLRIKHRLQAETKTKHYLDELKFIDICNDEKLYDKSGRKNAIRFLHDLGIVLHFPNLNLDEYYVLNPFWITYGVYQIITSSYCAIQKGIVEMDMLDYILNEEEEKKETYLSTHNRKYVFSSPNIRRFLVDILIEFKLAFYLTGRRVFIIPDLLDTVEPAENTTQVRNAKDSVRFVYSFTYLPNTTIPRILVESHDVVVKMWRTGCILKNRECQALIVKYENTVSITVIGEHKLKREFLAVIRHLIDSINEPLMDQPAMLIPLPEVNGHADYFLLRSREKKGIFDYIFDEGKPTERLFDISQLLEGIPRDDEVRMINMKLDNLLVCQKTMLESQQIFQQTLIEHYSYLMKYSSESDASKIGEAVAEVVTNQSTEVVREIMEWLAIGFEQFDQDINVRLTEIYDDLKKTDDLKFKLQISVPLINVLGINLGAEWDFKTWGRKMYEKYELKIFRLISAL